MRAGVSVGAFMVTHRGHYQRTGCHLVGIASLVRGVITSYGEQVEWHHFIASLVVGQAVGVTSVVAMLIKW